jgi:integrase/recombinase XerD
MKPQEKLADALFDLPPIQLIDCRPEPVRQTLPVQPYPAPSIADLRRLKVEEFFNSSSLSPNSRKLYQRELRRFLHWTDHTWTEFKPRHIALYKAYLSQEVLTVQGKPLAKSSINAALATLKSFFGWLRQCYPDLLPADPTVGTRFEKLPLPPVQSLSQEQVNRVWSALAEVGETRLRDAALLHLLGHGLRAGEVVALNVGAFDGRLVFLADTKTDEPRLVPLRQSAADGVQAYLDWRQAGGECLSEERPLLLSHHQGRRSERLSYHGLYYAIERLGELAGLPNLHPHQFRHTYATVLLLQGVDPMHAKRLTGHRSERAFKRYTLRSEQDAAIAAFYRAVGEAEKEKN